MWATRQEGLERGHEQKIRDGMFSFTWSSPVTLGEHPTEVELATFMKLAQKLENRAPSRFHALRTKAQYLPRTSDGWSEAHAISPKEAQDLLTNVGNNLGTFLGLIVSKMPEVLAALESSGKSDLLSGPRDFWPTP